MSFVANSIRGSHTSIDVERVIHNDSGFAEFYFLCFVWYDDRDEWQQYTGEHLQDLP